MPDHLPVLLLPEKADPEFDQLVAAWIKTGLMSNGWANTGVAVAASLSTLSRWDCCSSRAIQELKEKVSNNNNILYIGHIFSGQIT